MSSNDLVGEFPKRLKIYLVFAGTVFVLGFFSLIIIEDMRFIDALYFLIVTITTVGFGDITPTSDLTKLIVSILIIIAISTVALVSEQVVNRIVSINTQTYLELPEDPLPYHDHIIICGFTNIAENIAMLFQTRFFRIVVLDPHAGAVERARKLGIEAYFTQPEQHHNLIHVGIDRAMALYLFMDDENRNVLTSLQARSITSDLLIYAEAEHELSIELGQLIGIDRTYHYERIVASNILFSLQRLAAFSLPNQLISERAEFYQVLVNKDFDYKKRFPGGIIVGLLDETLTEFTPIEQIENIHSHFSNDWNYMLTVSREYIENDMEEIVDDTPTIIEKETTVDMILIGGYNDTSRHVLQELDDTIFKEFEFKILCFSAQEAELAEEEKFEVVHVVRENLLETLNSMCSSSTLLVNLFDRLTDSLLVNTVVRKTDLDIFIVQLAHNQIETEVLIKSGVNRILIPDILMSRGMFLILLSAKKFMNSTVWGNAHVFEHYIDDDSPLRGKSFKDLEKLGYYPLLYKKKNGEIVEHVSEGILRMGDNILLYKEHQIVRSANQLIDHVHN